MKDQVFKNIKGNPVSIDLERKQITKLDNGQVLDYSFCKPAHCLKISDARPDYYTSFKTPQGLLVLDVESSNKFRNLLNEKNKQKQKEQEIKEVEGVAELREAYNADKDGYERNRNAIANDKEPPVDSEPLKQKIAELEAKYPRAKVYLQAEAYRKAAHYAKVDAGRKAQQLLASGGSIADAEAILDNWLSSTNID